MKIGWQRWLFVGVITGLFIGYSVLINQRSLAEVVASAIGGAIFGSGLLAIAARRRRVRSRG